MFWIERSEAPRHLGRRAFVRTAGGSLLLATAATGCDFVSTEPSGGDRKGSGGRRGGAHGGPREAPMLAEQVKSGKLSTLKDRLPDKPLVLDPVDRTGVYGGDWNSALLGAADSVWLDRTIGYDPMMAWNLDFTKPVPNVAESLEADADRKTYTLRLRPGMKWSDGKPFTADDLVFWYDDVVRNDELGGVVPSDLTVRDKPARLEKLDDHTVRFEFADTNGLFPQYLATLSLGAMTRHPRHYLRQFHKKYAKNVEKLAEQDGFSDWSELFLAKADQWANVDLPTLRAWKLKTALGKGPRVVAERNPYYFKVDPDGRQLPYLDRVVYTVAQNDEALLLKVSHGEIDMTCWHVNTPSNKPVLARNRSKGGYRFFDLKWAWMNRMVIMFNFTHEDRKLAEVFRNRDFRIGLSYAINRQEMIDAVFQRQGEPWQAAPRRESEFYDEQLAKQYTEYDVQQANAHLDRAGYRNRDQQGFRLRPDGTRISFAVEVATPAALSPYWVDAMQLVKGYWKAVGVDARIKSEDRSLFVERTIANKTEATVWMGDGGMHDAILDPRYYFPYSASSRFAVAWANWYQGSANEQRKPPEVPRRQMKLYDQLKRTADRAERKDLFQQILRIAREEFYVIGTALPEGNYGIVKKDFHNVPQEMILSWMYPTPGPTHTEQYFLS